MSQHYSLDDESECTDVVSSGKHLGLGAEQYYGPPSQPQLTVYLGQVMGNIMIR